MAESKVAAYRSGGALPHDRATAPPCRGHGLTRRALSERSGAVARPLGTASTIDVLSDGVTIPGQ
jgi:hypothetical protein